jgi:hypothetical protein
MEKHFRKSVQVGLIGAGIQASRSPHLHECAPDYERMLRCFAGMN